MSTEVERLGDALRDMQLHWVRFYRTLPDGDYEGLGEMRQASIHAGKALVGEDYGDPDAGANQQAGAPAEPQPLIQRTPYCGAHEDAQRAAHSPRGRWQQVRIEQCCNGTRWMIARGKTIREQYFCFFVDSDRASWSRYFYNAAIYETFPEAEDTLKEIRQRVRPASASGEKEEK